MIITTLLSSAVEATVAPPSGPTISSTMAAYGTPADGAGGSSTELATVNYNGLIGVNGTDPFAVTTESNRMSGLSFEIQIIMCLFYGTLAFTAVASNMIVCYIVLSNQRMRTATNYFIVNLAVGDILMALLCIPFTFWANLIDQYWPFGPTLCKVVSYSQANSVFISAYTMVAISIDKYMAIMYPMRLRMPKTQAKIIILVIWSLALLTSLPTALLSELSYVDPDSYTPPTTTNTLEPSQPKINSNLTSSLPISSQTPDSSITMEDISSTPKFTIETTSSQSIPLITTARTTTTTTSSYKDDAKRHDKPNTISFCQENWDNWKWRNGKYYYSMALMILQFVLPLFVLVITYTRIVIVVWGKRMPGEEDNVRDARMARSKRKMIKMVIFCVIAFALTWLPFNTLIIYGEIDEKTWENQNIMYIWFTTHFLAMCHTVTNPLIYIWMNNRFRAGFKQVIGDIYKGSQKLLAYLSCYCLCCGCLFNCSRRKYARIMVELNRKNPRGPLTSSGSVNFPNNNIHHAHNGGHGASGFGHNGGHGQYHGGGGGGSGGNGTGGAASGAGATITGHSATNNLTSSSTTSATSRLVAGRSVTRSRCGPPTTSTGVTIGQPSNDCCESLLPTPRASSPPSGATPTTGQPIDDLEKTTATLEEGTTSGHTSSGGKPVGAGLAVPEDLRVSRRQSSNQQTPASSATDAGTETGNGICVTSGYERRRHANSQASGQRQLSSSNPSLGVASGNILAPATSGLPKNSEIANHNGEPEVVVVSGKRQAGATSATSRIGFRPMQMFLRKLNGDQETSASCRHEAACGESVDITKAANTKVKRRKKRRHLRSHNVALRLTTREFYQKPSGGEPVVPFGCGIISSEPYNHEAPTTTTKTSAFIVMRPAKQTSKLTKPVTNSATGRTNSRKVLVEMNQSSQSSATVSAQTNFTGLAISPLQSRVAQIQPAIDQVAGHYNANSNNNDNSTSASSAALSNGGNGGLSNMSGCRFAQIDHPRSVDRIHVQQRPSDCASGSIQLPQQSRKSPLTQKVRPFSTQSIDKLTPTFPYNRRLASVQMNDNGLCSASPRRQTDLMIEIRGQKSDVNNVLVSRSNRKSVEVLGGCVDNQLPAGAANQTNNSSEEMSPPVAPHQRGTISEQTSYLSHDDAEELLAAREIDAQRGAGRRSSHAADFASEKWITDHDIEASAHLRNGDESDEYDVDDDEEVDDEEYDEYDDDDDEEDQDVNGDETDEMDDLEIEYGDHNVTERSPMRQGQVVDSANNDSIRMVKLRTRQCDSNKNISDKISQQQKPLRIKHLRLLNRLFWSMDNHLNDQMTPNMTQGFGRRQHVDERTDRAKVNGTQQAYSELSELAPRIENLKLMTHHYGSGSAIDEQIKPHSNGSGGVFTADTTNTLATNGCLIRSANSSGNCNSLTEPLSQAQHLISMSLAGATNGIPKGSNNKNTTATAIIVSQEKRSVDKLNHIRFEAHLQDALTPQSQQETKHLIG